MALDVAAVQAYLHRHLAEVRSPQEVAAALGIPYHTLRKAFRRQVGLPLGTYLTAMRLERAQQYLRQSQLSCAEILYAVGFAREDVGYRAFKRHTGMSMQRYRQRHQEPDGRNA